MNNVVSFHRNDRGRRLIFPYNYLLLLKCIFFIYFFTVYEHNIAVKSAVIAMVYMSVCPFINRYCINMTQATITIAQDS